MKTCPANPQAGADPEAKEHSGQRAISVAAGAQQREIVELLLPHTAPEEGQEWTADALMELSASAAHQSHQHSECCGCGHEHPHVEEQVLARLGSKKTLWHLPACRGVYSWQFWHTHRYRIPMHAGGHT